MFAYIVARIVGRGPVVLVNHLTGELLPLGSLIARPSLARMALTAGSGFELATNRSMLRNARITVMAQFSEIHELRATVSVLHSVADYLEPWELALLSD